MLLVSMAAPAAAITLHREKGITSFDMEAPANGVISTVEMNNIPPNFNAVVTFDAYGELYELEIDNTRNWGYWTFDLTLTYPNSTVSTLTMKKFNPFASDADIKIQYFYGQADFVDVDLYLGLLPLTASFSNNLFSSSSWTNENLTGQVFEFFGAQYYTRLAFSQVSGVCTHPFDLEVTISTEEEFKKQQSEDLKEALSGTITKFFSWAWDNVLGFIGKIPGVGPYLEFTLIIGVAIIDNVFFYTKLFFIDYIETTILTLEFFILSGAVIKTRKKGNVFEIIDYVVTAHIALFTFIYMFAAGAVNLFIAIVRMVAQVVQSLKPI